MPLFDVLHDRILPCKCGRHPKIETAKASSSEAVGHQTSAAEDLVMIWVECECGAKSDLIEDAMIFSGMAEDAVEAWNQKHGQRGAA